jgi:hypothetical protein
MARRVDEWTQKQLAKHRKVAFSGCHNYNLAPTGRNVSQWPLSHYAYGALLKIGVPLGIRLGSADRSPGGRPAAVAVGSEAGVAR